MGKVEIRITTSSFDKPKLESVFKILSRSTFPLNVYSLKLMTLSKGNTLASVANEFYGIKLIRNGAILTIF